MSSKSSTAVSTKLPAEIVAAIERSGKSKSEFLQEAIAEKLSGAAVDPQELQQMIAQAIADADPDRIPDPGVDLMAEAQLIAHYRLSDELGQYNWMPNPMPARRRHIAQSIGWEYLGQLRDRVPGWEPGVHLWGRNGASMPQADPDGWPDTMDAAQLCWRMNVSFWDLVSGCNAGTGGYQGYMGDWIAWLQNHSSYSYTGEGEGQHAKFMRSSLMPKTEFTDWPSTLKPTTALKKLGMTMDDLYKTADWDKSPLDLIAALLYQGYDRRSNGTFIKRRNPRQ